MFQIPHQQIVQLLEWYEQVKRPIPWRLDPSPYKIWIGEVMSQQTILSVVIPRFDQFVSILPNVKALASASEENLRSLWHGLGYYSRARNLQKGASAILESSLGIPPSTYEEWLKIPGCGPYTAAMISSMAFGIAVPALDGNALRVCARLAYLHDQMWTKEGYAKIYQILRAGVEQSANAGAFNQAIMELGSLCCQKAAPNCARCPLQKICIAYQKQDLLLPAKPKRETLQTHLDILIPFDRRQQKIGVCHRTTGFLAGTSGFRIVDSETQLFGESITKVGQIKHSITHHRIHGQVLVVEVDIDNFRKRKPHLEVSAWIPVSEIMQHLSSSLDAKAWKLAEQSVKN